MSTPGHSEPFVLIGNDGVSETLEILKLRLPQSGHIYNMALILDKFPEEMTAYSLGALTSESIIMIMFEREDYGQDISISIPNNFELTTKIKDAFIKSTIIDWEGPHLFSSVDCKLSRALLDISINVFKNSVNIMPHWSYWISPDDALAPDYLVELEDNGTIVKRLEVESGLKFLLGNWKYARDGAVIYLRKIIDKHIAAGVFSKDGEILSGGVVNGHGIIGILNTPEVHRGKGYAKKGLKFLIREMALEGFVPVSTPAQENFYSLGLHEKAGMTITHETDYIFHVPFCKKSKPLPRSQLTRTANCNS